MLIGLTGVAVVALPAGQTDTLPDRTATVVAEVVVPRSAQILTALAVIVRHARHPVLVLHLRVSAFVLVHGPVRSDVQPFLGGQPRDQHFLWKDQEYVSCLSEFFKVEFFIKIVTSPI